MLQQTFDKFISENTSKTLDINGVTWKYFSTGSGSKTLVILPGGGSIAESAFQYILEFSKDYKVLTIDIPEIHSVDGCLDGVKKIIEAENSPVVDFLGFSMGGMMAQCFVRKYPESVNKLILFATMPPDKEYAKRYVKYGRGIGIVPAWLFRWISKRSLKKQILAENVPASEEEKDFWVNFFAWEFDSEKMDKKLLLATTDILIDYFGNYNFTSADLIDWKGEVQIFEADKDAVVEQKQRENLRAIYPNAKIITMENSGHFGLGLLNPAKLIEQMKIFLK